MGVFRKGIIGGLVILLSATVLFAGGKRLSPEKEFQWIMKHPKRAEIAAQIYTELINQGASKEEAIIGLALAIQETGLNPKHNYREDCVRGKSRLFHRGSCKPGFYQVVQIGYFQLNLTEYKQKYHLNFNQAKHRLKSVAEQCRYYLEFSRRLRRKYAKNESLYTQLRCYNGGPRAKYKPLIGKTYANRVIRYTKCIIKSADY